MLDMVEQVLLWTIIIVSGVFVASGVILTLCTLWITFFDSERIIAYQRQYEAHE